MRAVAGAIAVGLIIGCGACSLLVSTDGLAGDAGAEDAREGGVDAAASRDGGGSDAFVGVDAAGGADAADAADDESAALVELHPNGTFENGIAPWAGYQGTVESSPTARTGSHALRACVQSMPPMFGFFSADDSGAILDPVVGATYRATVWVRSDPASTAAPSGADILFRSIDVGPFAEVEKTGTAPSAISGTWVEYSVELSITKPAHALNVAIGGQYVNGACFLVDDVSVVRIR